LFKLSCANLRNPNVLTPYRIDVGFKSAILNILHENNMTLQASPKSSIPVISESSADFPIAQYLRQQIGEKITLEDISRHFNFHPHYLIELFRKNLNTTPMHYLQNLRLEKAKEYLEFTTLTVTEIADLTALSTPYFSRLFHNREGVTPSQYREQTRTVVGRDIVLEQDFLLDKQPLVFKTKILG
jgi:AraC family transcriptional regulator of arabinose operon